MVLRGHVRNGVVVLDEVIELPEGAEVEVAVVPPDSSDSTLGARLMKFAGRLDGLPYDLARNHDHYLHGVQMLQNTRRVLADCRRALDLLQEESQAASFRILWVAAIALARAVGHVLQKVDGERDDSVRALVATAYASWKADRLRNAIFWDFIEMERNQVLKQYELSFFAGPVDVVAGGQPHTLDDHLFCPIIDGPFAGEDCRDVLEQAIEWWEKQLAAIEASAIG